MKSLLFVALALSACAHVPAPAAPDTSPAMSDELADAATYKVLTPDRSQGTAWAVGTHTLITAGHICDAGPGKYEIISSDGVHLVAEPVIWTFDYPDDRPPLDVCAMRSEFVLPAVFPLAPAMPAEGTPVEYFGYPLGNHVHSEGTFYGDIDGPESFLNDYFADTPCDHGASGSAMYSDAGAYGVLVRLVVVGDQVLPGEVGCVATPLSQIVDVLDSI